METNGIVAGFEVTTIIDASGRVIRSRARPIKTAELEAWFARAADRGLDLRTGSQVDQANHPQRVSTSEQSMNRVASESRKTVEAAFALGCDSRRIKELLAEFPERRVQRALGYLEDLLAKGEDVKDPTALVVSLIVRWSNAAKNSRR
jgi:hypothetical protein